MYLISPSGVRGLFEQFLQYVENEKLFQPVDRLLVAVSGGVDSVVLCDLCKKAGFYFAIAHCNFRLREEESDSDEQFVKALAGKYNVEVFVKRFDTESYATKNKLSIQVAARNLRYDWFKSFINQTAGQPFNFLLTAHHANDNIETLLINFFKGTGLGGMQGILPKSGSHNWLIRPLLFAKKDALMSYADENILAYQADSSNNSDKYTRNFFRNRVIPLLREVYPQVENNLLANIKRLHEVNVLYRQSLGAIEKKLLVEKNGEYHLPVLKLLKTVALNTVLFEIIREYGFTPGQMDDVASLLKSESGKYVDSQTHRILRNRAWLIISKHGEKLQGYFLIEEQDNKIFFADQQLIIEKINSVLIHGNDPLVAQLDISQIKFPILLRKWKQGDYFYPLGMQKKKKLSRFFIDKKLSRVEKEKIWVLEMNKKIIWLAGLRIDDRFKITGATTNVLKLTLSPAKNAGML